MLLYLFKRCRNALGHGRYALRNSRKQGPLGLDVLLGVAYLDVEVDKLLAQSRLAVGQGVTLYLAVASVLGNLRDLHVKLFFLCRKSCNILVVTAAHFVKSLKVTAKLFDQRVVRLKLCGDAVAVDRLSIHHGRHELDLLAHIEHRVFSIGNLAFELA